MNCVSCVLSTADNAIHMASGVTISETVNLTANEVKNKNEMKNKLSRISRINHTSLRLYAPPDGTRERSNA